MVKVKKRTRMCDFSAKPTDNASRAEHSKAGLRFELSVDLGEAGRCPLKLPVDLTEIICRNTFNFFQDYDIIVSRDSCKVSRSSMQNRSVLVLSRWQNARAESRCMGRLSNSTTNHKGITY